MREWNGRFWVKRQRRGVRASSARAAAFVAKSVKALTHSELMSRQRSESVERTHALALEEDARIEWERFLGLDAGGGIEPPASSL